MYPISPIELPQLQPGIRKTPSKTGAQVQPSRHGTSSTA